MSRWTKHRNEWIECEECELCSTRKKVVQVRGKLPCDILFIGEAPGAAEDVIGQPFVGPAGKLLDKIISKSIDESEWRLAFTNLIACIPIDLEDGRKIREPHKEHIQACSDRLREVFEIANPSRVVMVGGLATKHVPKILDLDGVLVENIMHPAAILRADRSQRGLAIQRASIALEDFIEVPF